MDKKTLERSVAEHRKLIEQRDELDKQIASSTERIVAELRLLARKPGVDISDVFDKQEMPEEDEQSSLTDAIGELLRGQEEFLTASQVRDGLPRIGYSVSHYSDPLPTITTTLSRLVRSGDVIGQVVQGKMAYKWNASPFKHSPLKFLGQRYRAGGRRAQAGEKGEPHWWRYMKEQPPSAEAIEAGKKAVEIALRNRAKKKT
jgi:hypothetical protein